MNNGLISRKALKELISDKLDERFRWDSKMTVCEFKTIIGDIIDNVPPEPQVTVFAENASKEEIEDFKQELENVLERSQDKIRWVEELFVKRNGDIIDSEGRVVGHINLEIKDDAELFGGNT